MDGKFSHFQITVPSDLIAGKDRVALIEFFTSVLGWTEKPPPDQIFWQAERTCVSSDADLDCVPRMQNYMADSWQRYRALRYANEMCSYLPLEYAERLVDCFDRNVARAPQPAPADTMNSLEKAGYILSETAAGARQLSSSRTASPAPPCRPAAGTASRTVGPGERLSASMT